MGLTRSSEEIHSGAVARGGRTRFRSKTSGVGAAAARAAALRNKGISRARTGTSNMELRRILTSSVGHAERFSTFSGYFSLCFLKFYLPPNPPMRLGLRQCLRD